MTALAHPFDWHLHLFWSIAIPALGLGYARATRRPELRSSRRQVVLFTLGIVALVLALLWPLGDLAIHWSLVALVLQRLILTLTVPPLLVMGTPRPIIVRLTRPAPVDGVMRFVVKPVPAVCIVTVVAGGTLTTGLVSVTSDSELARVLIQILVLLSGFVLWAPVLTELPGARRLSTLGRGGYLIVQSIVPSFLSVVWIFARRPLYGSFNHPGRVLGMTALVDQQAAGFVAKLTTIAVLWVVAFTLMTRSQMAEDTHQDQDPLTWSDVEREIERADRRDRRRRGTTPTEQPPEPPPG